MRPLKGLTSLLAAFLVMLVLAGSALAQDPAGQGYAGQSAPLGGVAGEQSGSAGVQASGSLPFTGIDLALLVVGGIALAVVGAGLVRAGTER
jgi:hypothetical protein